MTSEQAPRTGDTVTIKPGVTCGGVDVAGVRLRVTQAYTEADGRQWLWGTDPDGHRYRLPCLIVSVTEPRR
ncbi:hypothetical protein GCM10022247_53080 [Allokutzneria multivorans]|uniref:Uncharacterized protein n=1 Tax=Allokutzneria multivorans TaxID=1142134 RepID=A0ABP7T7J4_9PSEU